jgi:hypothetical protein
METKKVKKYEKPKLVKTGNIRELTFTDSTLGASCSPPAGGWLHEGTQGQLVCSKGNNS